MLERELKHPEIIWVRPMNFEIRPARETCSGARAGGATLFNLKSGGPPLLVFVLNVPKYAANELRLLTARYRLESLGNLSSGESRIESQHREYFSLRAAQIASRKGSPALRRTDLREGAARTGLQKVPKTSRHVNVSEPCNMMLSVEIPAYKSI